MQFIEYFALGEKNVSELVKRNVWILYWPFLLLLLLLKYLMKLLGLASFLYLSSLS